MRKFRPDLVLGGIVISLLLLGVAMPDAALFDNMAWILAIGLGAMFIYSVGLRGLFVIALSFAFMAGWGYAASLAAAVTGVNTVTAFVVMGFLFFSIIVFLKHKKGIDVAARYRALLSRRGK